MRRIAIMNQKGGCGKTTTAVNLAGALAARGLRTLLVDLDPQGHCAAGLAIPESRLDADIGEAMLVGDRAGFDAERLIWRISRRLDLAPSRTRLASFDTNGQGADRPDLDWLLDRFLSRLSSQYDVCVIDTPPGSRNVLARNALAAASLVLVPVETSYYALQSATNEVATLAELGERMGVQPQIGVLPSVHEQTVALARDLESELSRRVNARMVPFVIRYDVAVKEAASFGQSVLDYNSSSDAATDFVQLATWTIDQLRTLVDHRPTAATAQAVRAVPGMDAHRELSRRVASAGIPGREGSFTPATHSMMSQSSRADDLARTARRMQDQRSVQSFSGHSHV
ncbi:MAG: ParA family protein [Phycisphaeraceae bacterium]|nr:ParA family protein [Phycisphaerales bacterium]MCB9860738.1 ParA family protein [Phycisphaeraceae bacterium]